MSYYKFNQDDLFINTIKAEPQYSFYIHSGSVYVDNGPHRKDTVDIRDATVGHNVYGVPYGYISLYEYNVDRPATQRIHPFVYKDGKRNSFKTITGINYETQYVVGDVVSSTYNMSASISVLLRLNQNYDLTIAARKEIIALKNTLNHYSYMSPHYQYSSSFGNKESQQIKLVSIPSIFYGSSIKKGTVRLDYYYTGSLLGSLVDNRKNGELVQISGSDPDHDGKVAGVVLYNEGFIILTGSWDLSNNNVSYGYIAGDGATKYPTAINPNWCETWGHGTDIDILSTTTLVRDHMLSSSAGLEYSGSTETQVLTMLSHAHYSELNYSNNPTSYAATTINKQAILAAQSGSYQYIEKPIQIKNVVSASYTDQEPPFRKTSYISKVGIYDKNKNLIGIAKLATPVKKTEDIDYTFKIKLDI